MSLFSFLKKKSQRALGVEISGRSIRWSEVSIGETAFEIETHGLLGVAYTPWTQNAEAQQKMIKDLAPLSLYKNIPLVCVLPETLTHTTYITVGLKSEEEVTAAVEGAVESYIVEHPVFITNDTVCLYDIIEQNNANITIVITLYQESKTKNLKEVFMQLGFSDVSFTPLHDSLQALYMNQDPTLMLSVANTHTSIIQMTGGQLQGYAQVPFGARDVVQQIRDVVGPERTEKVYTRYGMKSNHRDSALYARIVQQAMPLIDHAQRMMTITNKDHAIVITGDYADLPGLDTFLARQLRRVPVRLDVSQRFLSPDIRLPVIDAHDMLRFAPALGAAVDYLESR